MAIVDLICSFTTGNPNFIRIDDDNVVSGINVGSEFWFVLAAQQFCYLNRQLAALSSTIGMPKVDVMRARILDINPKCEVTAKKIFIDADNAASLVGGATYVVDAVDNVTAKLAIITACQKSGVPAISAMGAGNKLAGDFKVTDISKTSGDALARVMRRELRKRGIEHQKVVCTDSKAMIQIEKGEAMPSISYMPGLCGLVIAGEVVRDVIKERP